MSTKIVIVSCSAHPESEAENLLLYRSCLDGVANTEVHLDLTCNNREGLPVVYNRKLMQYANSDAEFLVFTHDDVYIDDLKLAKKLRHAHRDLGFEIIGLAGASKIFPNQHALWHLMSERQHQHGVVAHFLKEGMVHSSSYGTTPARVAIADGLFLAVHLPSVVKAGWRFNENYRFHHYDIASCLDALVLGLSIGVCPIHVIHKSLGLGPDKQGEWEASNAQFLAEYGTQFR